MGRIQSGLFLKFFLLLLGICMLVVMLMVGVMQFFVYRHFSDYVLQQELDGLGGLADAFSTEYEKGNSWEKFRNNPRLWYDTVSRFFPDRSAHLPPPPGPGFQATPPDRAARDRSPPPRRHQVPELSSLARRLSLFDSNKRVVFGNPVRSEQAIRPIQLNSQVIGWLGLKREKHLSRPTDVSFLKAQSRAFYLIGAVVLVISVLVSVFLSFHLLAPIKRIAAGTRALRNRRFDTRITVTSNDEIGQLAQDFNMMARTFQRYEMLRRQWLSDIAHELRTPLAILQGEIEALQDGLREFNVNTADSLHSEVLYLSKMVTDLALIAKTESSILEMKQSPIRPVGILHGTLKRFQSRFHERGLHVETKFNDCEPARVMGNEDRLIQVFTNIFENALRYASSPGTIFAKAVCQKDHVRISIEDTGPGVPGESLSRLFDRLYRTDAARTRESGGSGLGLSICKSIVDAHQGRIWSENAASGGLRIVMRLPRHQP